MAKTKEEMKAYHHAHYVANRERYNTLSKAWREAHPEWHLEYQRAWRKTPQGKLSVRNGDLKRNYNKSDAWVRAQVEANGGRCRICGTSDFGPQGPVVHHDHVTREVLDVICHSCNITLGGSKESIRRLKACIQYVYQKNTCLEKDMPASWRE